MACVVIGPPFSLLDSIPLGDDVTIYRSSFLMDRHGGSFQVWAVTDSPATSVLVPWRMVKKGLARSGAPGSLGTPAFSLRR